MRRIKQLSTTAICILAFAFTADLTKADESLAAETEVCEASWYGPGFQGNDMANGQRFDMNDITVVAHKTLPFGTRLRVTNLDNGESIVVEVQDRGPFIAGRCVDLSRAGAIELGYYCGPRCGTARVRVEPTTESVTDEATSFTS